MKHKILPLPRSCCNRRYYKNLPFMICCLMLLTRTHSSGGMPEPLAVFGETGSYSAVREIYDAIFMGYIEDVEKYSNLAKAKYLIHAIDRAPLYAGERITYEKFGDSSFRSREMKEAFDVLERALILYRSRPSVSTRIPIIEKLRKAPKLFFLDVGLVNFRIGSQGVFHRTDPGQCLSGKNF